MVHILRYKKRQKEKDKKKKKPSKNKIKKDKIMQMAATWMELEIHILSEVSQKEKDKYHTKSVISGI